MTTGGEPVPWRSARQNKLLFGLFAGFVVIRACARRRDRAAAVKSSVLVLSFLVRWLQDLERAH